MVVSLSLHIIARPHENLEYVLPIRYTEAVEQFSNVVVKLIQQVPRGPATNFVDSSGVKTMSIAVGMVETRLSSGSGSSEDAMVKAARVTLVSWQEKSGSRSKRDGHCSGMSPGASFGSSRS